MLRTTSHHENSRSDTEALLEIGPKEIAGPFDLSMTVKSGQTGMPEWLWKDDAFSDLVHIKAGFVSFRLKQAAGPFVPKLHLEIRSPVVLSDAGAQQAKVKIAQALDLQRNLQSFYDRFSSDVVAEAFERFPGMRVMRAWDPFEALISCMLTQYSSVKGWNTVARRLRKSFGTAVRFTDGSISYSPPTPENLASASMEELRRCGTGFRAKYLKEAAGMVASGEVVLGKVQGMQYHEAKEHLTGIPGVGTKVADCLLLYGYGMLEAAPVDVWMHRVIQRLYLKGEKLGQKKAEEFLRGRFGPWAGYAQLYLYHYARMRPLY